MDTKLQMLCAWASPAFVVSFWIGIWMLSGYVPVKPATWGEAEVMAYYQGNSVAILAGLLVCTFSATCWIPFAVGLADQMKRMCHPVLANLQLALAISTSVFILLPMEVWMAAAYRPERSPELLLIFHDFAYIMFVGLVIPAWMQVTTLGIACLSDRNPSPIFPRWVGWFCIWCAFLTLTGGLIIFFYDGPFAWDGIIAFYMPLCIWMIWWTIMFFVLRNAILKEKSEYTSATG